MQGSSFERGRFLNARGLRLLLKMFVFLNIVLYKNTPTKELSDASLLVSLRK
jgi:hypothetical protein